MAKKVEKHFVTFYSPGTFMAEASEYPIASWDVEKAKKMAEGVRERHGAVPTQEQLDEFLMELRAMVEEKEEACLQQ